jgi:hypothetical protein
VIWTSADYWSYWKSSKEKARNAEDRARRHKTKRTASGKEKKPCEGCVRADLMGFGGCDYWSNQEESARRHGEAASGHRHRARELELEEGKPQTHDGVKLQSVYNRELEEERERKWAEVDAEEEKTPEPHAFVPEGMRHWLIDDNER